VFPQPVPVNERGLMFMDLCLASVLDFAGHTSTQTPQPCSRPRHSDSHVVAWEILERRAWTKSPQEHRDRFGGTLSCV